MADAVSPPLIRPLFLISLILLKSLAAAGEILAEFDYVVVGLRLKMLIAR